MDEVHAVIVCYDPVMKKVTQLVECCDWTGCKNLDSRQWPKK
jgi:hypothetical protein